MTAKTFNDIPLSVLDLAPVLEGSTPEQSFKNSVELAKKKRGTIRVQPLLAG